jgi:DNA-binding MarR family transcriptional regulator
MPSTATLPCMCASFRRAARGLTQAYDEALRPLGLRVTQFTILQALALAGEASQGELGELLVMDSTSLTRTLRPLSARGWIEDRRGKDRRERRLRLSAAGRRQLQRATPRWEAVQSRLRGRLGEARWGALKNAATEITDALRPSIA